MKLIEEMARKENNQPELGNNYLSQYYKTPIKESLGTHQDYQNNEYKAINDL
jgi:hypothetical protein